MKDVFKKRKAFSFYRSYWDVINDLSDEQAGELIKGIAKYQFTGEHPKFKGVLNAVWKGFETLVDGQVSGYLNGSKTDNSNKRSKSTPNRGSESDSISTTKSTPNNKEKRVKSKEQYLNSLYKKFEESVIEKNNQNRILKKEKVGRFISYYGQVVGDKLKCQTYDNWNTLSKMRQWAESTPEDKAPPQSNYYLVNLDMNEPKKQ